jgi:predicted lipoprotein with Yx(FWY)xxD motif
MRILTQFRAARRARPHLLSLSVAAAASLAIAACGSSSPSNSSNASSGPNNGSQSTSQSPTHSSAGSVATTKVPGYGTVLATAKGAPVYLLSVDPSGGSSCSGTCAKQWSPLTVTGKPTAGSGVTASMLSSFKRSDGGTQILYNGHALYTHPGGLNAASVAGTASDGGIWYLVSPTGDPVKKTTGSGY